MSQPHLSCQHVDSKESKFPLWNKAKGNTILTFVATYQTQCKCNWDPNAHHALQVLKKSKLTHIPGLVRQSSSASTADTILCSARKFNMGESEGSGGLRIALLPCLTKMLMDTRR